MSSREVRKCVLYRGCVQSYSSGCFLVCGMRWSETVNIVSFNALFVSPVVVGRICQLCL